MSDSSPRVSIIMRSCNDSDVIRGTLQMVRAQTYTNYELWNFDSTSTDGTLDIIREFNAPERIRLNDPASYNPGRVLNTAVATTAGDILVFLNSDATPENEDWLERLIAPLQDTDCGAAYVRQTPRPDCRSLFIKDTERAFGDGHVSAGWLHFFPWQILRCDAICWNAIPSIPTSSIPRISTGPIACASSATTLSMFRMPPPRIRTITPSCSPIDAITAKAWPRHGSSATAN